MFRFVEILIFVVFSTIFFVRSAQNSENCFDGPDFWCLNKTTEDFCNFTKKSIGVCGYSNKRCPIESGDEFCPKSSDFNGGITGANENQFSFYMLSLYWPPSSCPSVYDPAKDFLEYFCSSFTDRGQPGSERLVLHGLWPTFSTNGNYQGWPQFCTAQQFDWSKCHVNGNLCPWSNATKSGFSQGEYEYCLSVEKVSQCLVDGEQILRPFADRLKVFAPGYLNKRNLFINHEWTKHGSCCSSTFNNNISTYLDTMLKNVEKITAAGTPLDELIQKNVGKQIRYDSLIDGLNRTAIVNCNRKCQIEEIWFCVDRDASSGGPNSLIQCPEGSFFTDDSCRKSKCDLVSIPSRN